MTTPLDTRNLGYLLAIAASVTCHPNNPNAVTAHADILLKWLDSAPNDDDWGVRWAALRRAYANDDDNAPADDPQRLIAAAEVYARYIAARRRPTPEGRLAGLRRLWARIRRGDRS